MRPGQDVIHVLVGEDGAALAASPQLEGYRARGLEVLLLTDPIDAFWPDRFDVFDGRTIRSITQSEAMLAGSETDAAPDISPLSAALAKALGDAVSEVRSTNRLVNSAVVLAAAKAGPDLQTQRLLRRSGRGLPGPPPVLEINPVHPLIARLQAQLDGGESLDMTAWLLLDLARVQDGELPRDPAAFARQVTELLAKSH
jgi:molecular chaperone HtpG